MLSDDVCFELEKNPSLPSLALVCDNSPAFFPKALELYLHSLYETETIPEFYSREPSL